MTASQAVTDAEVHGLPADQHDYGMARGHSPVAEKVAAIDFDGTLVPWGPLMGDKDPEPEAKEAIDALIAAGYTIVIFTSRLSRTWARSVVGPDPFAIVDFLNKQERYVREQLDRAGIRYSHITAEKVPAEFYIDDKAWRYEPGEWKSIARVALVNAAGGRWYTYNKTHRVKEVRVERGWKRTDPAGGRWYGAVWTDFDVVDKDGFTPTGHTRLRVVFACGDFDNVYGWQAEGREELEKRARFASGPGLNGCLHCLRSRP